MLTIKQGRVPNSSDENAAPFIGNPGAELLPLSTLDPLETEFDQLMRAQAVLKLGDECRRQPALPEFESRIHLLPETAKI